MDLATTLYPLYTLPVTPLLRGPALHSYQASSHFERFCRLQQSNRLAPLVSGERIASKITLCKDYLRRRDIAYSQLDNKIITEKLPSFKSTLELFGLMSQTCQPSKFHQILADFNRATSRRSWDVRLQLEAFEATEKQWFIVFDTITYDPGEYSDEVMYGKYWAQYRTTIQNSVVRRAFGSVKKFKRSGDKYTDYVRYFAVPELHKDGRTHLHILWFLKELPDVASEDCPNMFREVPNRRQINGWPPFRYGTIAMRLAVRYTGDAFSKRLGWRWPVVKGGQRLPSNQVFAVARYVAKYLDKPRPEALQSCRVRTSQSLGLTRLQSYLATLSIPQLTMLIRNPQFSQTPKSIEGVKIPMALIKVQAIREISIQFRNLNLPIPKQFDLLRSVMGQISPPPLRENFSLTERIQQISRLANFIDSVMNTLTNGDISELEAIFHEDEKPSTFMTPPCHKPSLGVLQ